MRKFIISFATLGAIGLFGVTATNAAPVPGFESFYDAVFASCTLPDGTLPACETAINAYAGALVAADIPIETANESFIALRAAVYVANAADEAFQIDIDALFELLLPDSGAIDPSPSPTLPG